MMMREESTSMRKEDARQTRAEKILFLPVLLIVAVSFAVYFNALSNGFVYDDQPQIVENPWIRDLSNISRIFTSNVWSFIGKSAISNYYRPLMHTMYILNFRLFGLDPQGFHLVNLLFHAGNSILVYLLLLRLIPGNRASAETGNAFLSPPFIAAILFAAHPVHTEAVTWIAGLPDVSFTFFCLLALWFYMKYREGSGLSYPFSVASFGLAALCKEPALTLPVILIAYDSCFNNERPAVRRLKAYMPFFVVSAGYLGLRLYALGGFAPQKPHIHLSTAGYFINVFPLFGEYLQKLLLPVRLNAFHVLHPITSLFELNGLLALLITLVFAVSSLLLRKKSPTAFFGSLLIVVPLLPALYIPALGENVLAERYLYFPSVGFVVILAAFLARSDFDRRRVLVSLIFLSAALIYSAGTVDRNRDWRNEYTLFTDTLEKTPDAAMIHYDLGNYFVKEGNLDAAAREYLTAIQLKPAYDRSHTNLGNILRTWGRIEEAVMEYEAAVRFNPYNPEAHNNLGVGYAYLGRTEDAILEFKTALALNPADSAARRNLGLLSNQPG